ncbi:MAG: hypothetical protein LQ342_002967 [Letrouitia transgressa]|nr:MAG: hypothetical protein LQ342_002967 [Letrouitia transgressa]
MSTAARDELALLNRDQEKHFTRHPEDVSESASDNDSTTLRSSDDDRAFNSRPSNNMRATTYHIPSNTNFIANTGPKGVIADARSYDTARKRSFRQTLRAYSNGELSPPLFGKSKKKAINFNREKSASPDSSSSTDEDEDFMRTWRANRLDELASMSQDIRTRRSSPSMRKYGTLVTVDPIGYLDAVEKVHADTTVIVLIYDDESASSQMVEDALHSLARKHATVRFIKLHYLDAEMDEIAVPGILAYKGGDCFANLVSVMNEIPTGQGVNSSALELLLQQYVLHSLIRPGSRY